MVTDAAGVFTGVGGSALSAECGGIAGATGCPTMTYDAPQMSITMDGDLGDWTNTGPILGQTAFLP